MADLNEDVNELEEVVEKLDNSLRKNNLKIRGLKEEIEGRDLVRYLTELFTEWVGSDCELEISLLTANWVGLLRKEAKFP